MSSTLYRCRIGHYRSVPRAHHFQYDVFLLALDLDELDATARAVRFFSHNRRNVTSFRDDDHLPGPSASLRENLDLWLRARNVSRPARVTLLTAPRIFGYVFNPVCFYVGYDEAGVPLCAVAEVRNTFGEMKPFLLTRDDFDGAVFRKRVIKHFYISPFLEVDDELEFRITPPGGDLHIDTDTWRGSERILSATLRGTEEALTSASLAYALLRFPLVTLKIMAAIHWEAFRLWLKNVPHRAKRDRGEDQREVIGGRSRIERRIV